jgi:hypothetical protein
MVSAADFLVSQREIPVSPGLPAVSEGRLPVSDRSVAAVSPGRFSVSRWSVLMSNPSCGDVVRAVLPNAAQLFESGDSSVE